MSIIVRIAELAKNKALIKYQALRDIDEPEERAIWLIPEFYNHICNDSSITKSENDYRANIRSYLSDFVIGQEIYYSHEIWRLDPSSRNLWEIKITLLPQTRLFGGFAYKNCFICTHWSFRDDLKKKGSPEWIAAENKAIKNWNTLFPNWTRCSCWPLSQCITGAYDE